MTVASGRAPTWARPDAPLTRAAIGAALLTGLAAATGAGGRLDAALSDAWFSAAGLAPSGRVVIVDTARAAAEAGDPLRLPRARLAELLDRIAAAGAARTLIEFGLPGRTAAADDAALADALARLGPERVGLSLAAIVTTDGAGATRWSRTEPAPAFAARARRVASDLAFDPDGLLRRQGIAAADLDPLPPGSDWLAGVPAARDGGAIDFGIDARRIPVVDASDLLAGRGTIPLEGRGVLLANFTRALGGEIRVPRFSALRRPEITALAAETALSGRRPHAPPRAATAAAAVALSIAAALWCARLGPLLGTLALAGLGLCAVAAAATLQATTGLTLPLAELGLAALIGHLAGQMARGPFLRRARGADPGLAGVLEGTGEALVTFAPTGRILSMNAEARRLFPGSGPADGRLADLLGAQADDLMAATRLSRPGRLAATLGRDGVDRRHLDLTVNAMPAARGAWIGVATIRDVTDQQVQMEALRRAASQDPLTGLANRSRFEEVLAQACARMGAGEAVAVMLCDLDGFKAVNDTLGHQAGDALLREIARRLAAAVEPGTTVARLGGDEFALVRCVAGPDGAADRARLHARARALVAVVAEPIALDGRPVEVGVSIGLAVGPGAGCSPAELVEAADAAMYRAKRGRSGVVVAPDAPDRGAPAADGDPGAAPVGSRREPAASDRAA